MTGVLTKPKCKHCGFRVPNDAVVGAGCPKCGRRLLPEPVIAAGSGAEEPAELVSAEEGGGDASA